MKKIQIVKVQVRLLPFFKFLNDKYDYVLVDKSLKVSKNNRIEIISGLWGWKIPIYIIRDIKEIRYNLLIKGKSSNLKLIVLKYPNY